MTIALLTDGIWPFVVGGMQRHSYYLCKYLALNGVTVELYHSSKNGLRPNLSESFTEEELSHINDHFIRYPSRTDRLPGHYLRTSYKYSEIVYQAVIANRDIDLIYSKGLTAWKLLKEKQKGLALPPVCVNVHGYEYYQQPASLRNRLEQFMLRPAFKYMNTQADFIYSYGWPITKIIKRHIPNSAQKIIEIPGGVEAEIIRQTPITANAIRRFVFIGRYERRKGVPELFDAIQRIDPKFNFQFHFIGALPENLKIRSSKIVYHGLLKNKWQLKQILEDSDVLVCPSYAEGMPNVILEAMAAGCAIVASNVGAIPMIVSEANGWLIEPGSQNDLIDKLSSAIEITDESLIKKKRQSVDLINSTFRWDKIIAPLIDSFNRILLKREDKGVSQIAKI
jgi:glycosyltransferase involved in cell wall biosynthesis